MSLRIKGDSVWTSTPLKFTPIVYILTLMLCLAVLIVSGILGRHLSTSIGTEEKYFQDYRKSGYAPTTVQIVFYEATIPFISLIQCVAFAALHTFKTVAPIVSLAVTPVFLVGWAAALSLWGNCDIAYWGDSNLDFCSHWPTKGARSTPLQYVRLVFGGLAMGGYLCLLVFSAIAVHRQRASGPKKSSV